MERVIKFRAWSVKDKVILDWSAIKQTAFNYGNVNLLHSVLTSNDETYIVMQFTGLTDKNNKDIYEGDILKGKSGKLFSVVWSGAGFKLKGKNRPYATSGTSSLEIMGNIFENPELLSTDKTKTV